MMRAKDPDDGEGALRAALNIIGYKDNTERRLREKLRERGYSDAAVDIAIEKVKAAGYLNEMRMMSATVEYLANVKLYGKARIAFELRRMGFSRDVTDSLDYDSEELRDIDFARNCVKLLQRRGGVPDEKDFAFAKRYGHSASDIIAAAKFLKN